LKIDHVGKQTQEKLGEGTDPRNNGRDQDKIIKAKFCVFNPDQAYGGKRSS